MITPSFGLTATERVLPKLALDFTTALLDSRITFTRTTGASNPATYVDSAGTIVAAANDAPRFDYDPISLVCKGLLVEESRVNYLRFSEDFSNVNWVPTNASVTINVVTAPNGTMTADKLVMANGANPSAANNTGVIQSNTLTSGVYTYSVFAKAAEFTSIRFRENVFSGSVLTVDLTNGAITNGSITQFVAPVATAYKDGWWRISWSSPNNMTNTNRYLIRAGSTGDGTSGIYIWGAQLEAGAFPTSYIPTTTTALTRNADVATMTGTNFSDFWQATKGGASVIATPSTVSGIRPLVQFDDGTVNEIIALRGNTTNPELQIVDGGAPQAQIDAGTIVANTPYGLTGWWQTNDCKARQNAGAVVSDYTATIPTVTQARLGSDGTNYLNGHLATINYYDRFTGQIYDRRKNKAVFSLL